MNVTTCEVWLCVDSCGDYAVGNSEDAAKEAYESEIQNLDECGGYRLVRLEVKVPTPATIELSAVVGADEAAAVAV